MDNVLCRAGQPKEHLEAFAKSIAASNPLGRMGSVEEAAAVAAFLPDEASYVMGSDYAVDGGETQRTMFGITMDCNR